MSQLPQFMQRALDFEVGKAKTPERVKAILLAHVIYWDHLERTYTSAQIQSLADRIEKHYA